MLCRYDNKAENETDNENDDVPPPRGLLIVLCHVFMVTIVKFALSSALVGFQDVTTPKEKDVEN